MNISKLAYGFVLLSALIIMQEARASQNEKISIKRILNPSVNKFSIESIVNPSVALQPQNNQIPMPHNHELQPQNNQNFDFPTPLPPLPPSIIRSVAIERLIKEGRYPEINPFTYDDRISDSYCDGSSSSEQN